MSVAVCFYLPTLRCINCENALKRHLESFTGYKVKYQIDLASKMLTVFAKDAVDEVLFRRDIYNKLKEKYSKISEKPYRTWWDRAHLWLGIIGTGLGSALMLTMLFAPALPLIAMIAIGIISSALIVFLGLETFRQAWDDGLSMGMDTLFSLGIITALTVSIAAFFVPWLPMLFETGLLILGIRHIGLAIEQSLRSKISYGSRFVDKATQTVTLEDGTKQDVNLLQKDSVVYINSGETLAFNAKALDDATDGLVNTIQTGKFDTEPVSRGQDIYAGAVWVGNSQLKVKVKALPKDSHLANLDNMISESLTSKSSIEITSRRWLKYFIPSVLALSLLSGLLIGFFFTPVLGIGCAISILVSSCPCVLGLITPLSVQTGVKSAADRGVLFKGADAVEGLSETKTVVVDLNGTLTHPPKVKRYASFSNMSRDEILRSIINCEKDSKHPIAKIILQYGENLGIKPKDSVLHERHHNGRSVLIDGEMYSVGNAKRMRELGVVIPEIEIQHEESIVYLAKGLCIKGYLILESPLREDAQKTLQRFRDLGIEKIIVCTGSDDETTARRYIQGLPCDELRINQSPNEKSELIKKLRADGETVLMIGDEYNDVPAMAKANISMVLGKEFETNKSSEIHIKKLSSAADAIDISKQTMRHIKQNFAINIAYNAVTMLLAGGLLLFAGIALNPAVGVLLMGAQICFVLLTVYLFKRNQEKQLQVSEKEELSLVNSHSKIMNNIPGDQLLSGCGNESKLVEIDEISALPDNPSPDNSIGESPGLFNLNA